MRVNKGKFVRKYLRFYRIVFRIQDPYKIILDGNFIFQAIKYKLDIQERLQKLLQGCAIRLFIQQSVLDEFRLVGSAAKLAQDWAIKYCMILNDSQAPGITPASKMISYIQACQEDGLDERVHKKTNYFVASQDKDLRHELAKIPGVPTIYFNKVSLVLEPPSKASRSYGNKTESQKLSLNSEEEEVVKNMKLPSSMSIVGVDGKPPVAVAPVKVRVKHKAKAPNPLSMRQANKSSKAFKKRQSIKFKRS